MDIPVGYCQCGCGQRTKVMDHTDRWAGYAVGESKRFVNGHNKRVVTGDKHANWKGGEIIDSHGYLHTRVNKRYRPQHIIIAENILGKPLPQKAVIHHIDGNKSNNNSSNLVICEDNAYHQLLHLRARAKKECGHADWRKCPFCKEWDAPANMAKNGKSMHHRRCRNEYKNNRRNIFGRKNIG